MLKPIKSLLTYLQRNANSSTILGSTNGMGPMEEPTLATTNEDDDDMMTSEDLNCEDPLYDPLALDNDDAVDCDNDEELNASNVSAATSCGELDTSTGGPGAEIILVDVTSFKGDSSVVSEEELENNNDDPVNISVNGLNDSGSSLENGPQDETKSTNLEDDSFATASCGETPNLSINGEECLGIAVPEEFVRHAADEEKEVLEAEEVKSRTTTEMTTEEVVVVATTQEAAEEEEASDGSDSGLGSEPSRNLSILEKEMAEIPPVKSNLKRRSEPEVEATGGASAEKRPKKGITFDGVTVYYFSRMQGFGCVPSQGGCTLGMEFQHMHSRRFTLAEHAAEQRKMHRAQLQELNPRSSSSEETDSEEEPSESGSEAESESYGFLQPVTTRQRRALLKAAGVRKIDSTEKDECRVIRTSREVCGCTCRGYCDPDTCACSQAGIKCQVDRPNFPCGCTQDGCGNVVGRVEFNPARVRTHFIHTIMRLNLDNKATVEERGMGGMHAGNSYGSAKDWSSGPVRLPGLYHHGMVNGGVDAVDSYHHHHQLQLQQQQQQHQYGASHSYLGSGVPPGSESLDLHYAFRDYYAPAQQTNDPLSMSSQLMAPYYGNYPVSMDQQYHQPHHSLLVLDQRQPDPHSPYHSQGMEAIPSSSVMLDEDTTLNTPINPNFSCDDPIAEPQPSTSRTILEMATHLVVQQPASSSGEVDGDSSIPSEVDPLSSVVEVPPESGSSPQSADFIDLNTPLPSNSDRLEAINDLLETSRHTISALVRRQSIIAEEDDELSDFRDPPIMPLPSLLAANTSSGSIIVLDSCSEPCSAAEDDTQEEMATLPLATLHNGDPASSLTNGDRDEELQSEITTSSSDLPASAIAASSCETVIETSENLSEIIKNSIVETVSN